MHFYGNQLQTMNMSIVEHSTELQVTIAFLHVCSPS